MRWFSGSTSTTEKSTPFNSSIFRAACEGWDTDCQYSFTRTARPYRLVPAISRYDRPGLRSSTAGQ